MRPSRDAAMSGRLAASAKEARIERVDRHASEPLRGDPYAGKIVHDRLRTGERRDLDAGNEPAVMGRQAIGAQDGIEHSGAAEAGAQPLTWIGHSSVGPVPRSRGVAAAGAHCVLPHCCSAADDGPTAEPSSDDRRPRLAAEWIAPAKILGDLLECKPFDAIVAVDVLDQALEHEDYLRPTAHVRVYGHRENAVVHLTVDPVELFPPHVLDVGRADEAVAVRDLLHEQHRWQVVHIPVGADPDEVDLFSVHHRPHPLLGALGVVDHGPGVADPRVEWLEVAIALAVV